MRKIFIFSLTFLAFSSFELNAQQGNMYGVWTAMTPTNRQSHPNTLPSENEHDTLTIKKNGQFILTNFSQVIAGNFTKQSGTYKLIGDTLSLNVALESSLYIADTGDYINTKVIRDKTIKLTIIKIGLDQPYLTTDDKIFYMTEK